jgi:hypothetical protein
MIEARERISNSINKIIFQNKKEKKIITKGLEAINDLFIYL